MSAVKIFSEQIRDIYNFAREHPDALKELDETERKTLDAIMNAKDKGAFAVIVLKADYDKLCTKIRPETTGKSEATTSIFGKIFGILSGRNKTDRNRAFLKNYETEMSEFLASLPEDINERERVLREKQELIKEINLKQTIEVFKASGNKENVELAKSLSSHIDDIDRLYEFASLAFLENYENEMSEFLASLPEDIAEAQELLREKREKIEENNVKQKINVFKKSGREENIKLAKSLSKHIDEIDRLYALAYSGATLRSKGRSSQIVDDIWKKEVSDQKENVSNQLGK